MKNFDISVTHLPGINYIVMKKASPSGRFFFSNDDTFAIPIDKLSFLLYYLVMNKLISPKILEGILEEYYSTRS